MVVCLQTVLEKELRALHLDSQTTGRDNDILGLAWTPQTSEPSPMTYLFQQGHTYFSKLTLPNSASKPMGCFSFRPPRSWNLRCGSHRCQNHISIAKSLFSVSLCCLFFVLTSYVSPVNCYTSHMMVVGFRVVNDESFFRLPFSRVKLQG